MKNPGDPEYSSTEPRMRPLIAEPEVEYPRHPRCFLMQRPLWSRGGFMKDDDTNRGGEPQEARFQDRNTHARSAP